MERRSITKHWDEIRRFLWRHCASDWQRANHYLRKTDRGYEQDIAAAYEAKEPDRANDLYGEWRAVREDDQYEVNRLRTIRWERKATKRFITLPDLKDELFWTHHGSRGTVHLTNLGVEYIETTLYERSVRRWDLILKIATVLVGLIGATTGLVAVLMRRR